jgi:hypothetical protein
MKKKLPFTIIHKNNNIDLFFNLHPETKDEDVVGKVAEELINNIDKQLKKYATISDGDLIQSLAILIATRIHISPFDNTKMINLMNQLIKNGHKEWKDIKNWNGLIFKNPNLYNPFMA